MVLGPITLPTESSQLILMWFDYGMQKINIAGPGEAGYQSCIKLWPMVEHAQKCFWHHHPLHQQLSFENSLAGTKNNTRLLQYLRTKNRHCYRHQTVDVGDSVGNKIDRLHVVSGTHSSESYYRTSIWPRHPYQVQRAILQPVFWYHQGLTILPSAG